MKKILILLGIVVLPILSSSTSNNGVYEYPDYPPYQHYRDIITGEIYSNEHYVAVIPMPSGQKIYVYRALPGLWFDCQTQTCTYPSEACGCFERGL